MTNIKDKILEKIHDRKIKKLPKIYFILKSLSFILGLILIALVSAFLTSFIIFSTRASGALYLAHFGPTGIKGLLLALPWLLFFVIILLIVFLWILINYFPFSYRKPLTYSLLGVLIIIFIGSAIILNTSMHENFSDRALKNHLPIAGNLYVHYQHPMPDNLYKGIVSEINNQEIQILTLEGEDLKVLITEETRLPFGKDFVPGDSIVVGGKRAGDVIIAFGIAKMKRDLRLMK